MIPIKQAVLAVALLGALGALESREAFAQAEATKGEAKAKTKDPPKAKEPAKAQPAPIAASASVALTPFDLIAGKVPDLTGGRRDDIVDGTCTLAGQDHGWTFHPADCPQLVSGARQIKHGTLTITLMNAKSLPADYTVKEDAVTLTSKIAVVAIAWPSPDGWARVEVTNGVATDAKLREALQAKEPPKDVWAVDAAGTPYKLQLNPPRPISSDLTKAGAAAPACFPSDDHTDSWCPGGDRVICIDATAGFSEISFGPRNHIVIPNKSLDVYVRRPDKQGVEISQQGKRGLYEPGVKDYTTAATPGLAPQAGGGSCDLITHASFAPRQPGSADVKIQLHDPQDRTKVVEEHTLELEVDTTYAGAIRLGFSTLFGRAVDRAYAAQTGPGSSTLEVSATDRGDVNVEAVVSFSTYVFDLIVQGGRTYATRSLASYVVPSPYIAVGLVTPKAGSSGVRAVPSLHLGAEWELSKSFSVGIDAVARRVTRLSDGFAIGSPVSTGTIFTESQYEWGWSFTFTVSPEFFQFAVGKP